MVQKNKMMQKSLINLFQLFRCVIPIYYQICQWNSLLQKENLTHAYI